MSLRQEQQWMKGLSLEQTQKIRDYYQKRYEQPPS
jgi:hypothetical protein